MPKDTSCLFGSQLPTELNSVELYHTGCSVNHGGGLDILLSDAQHLLLIFINFNDVKTLFVDYVPEFTNH